MKVGFIGLGRMGQAMAARILGGGHDLVVYNRSRDKAAELIAKVKGCSTSEAKELTTRLVIPLAKNVSKNKAEDILNQFKKLKIFGRMTKVK